MLLLFFSIAVFPLVSAQAAVDLTLENEQTGTSVVLATISKIREENIFSDDNRLLRRVAFVESRDGTAPDTFREGYNGGIWQVDEMVFQFTQSTALNPQLVEVGGIYQRLLESSLRVNWRAVRWADLRVPLFSALAARIYFELSSLKIPPIGNVKAQGQFWKDSNFNTREEDTVAFFVEEVNLLELEECPNRGIDLAFLLDSSGSVGPTNFELEKKLVNDLVERFAVGEMATQVAVVSYSGIANVNFHLNNFTTRAEVQSAVQSVPFCDKPGPTSIFRRTNTAAGLALLRTEVFSLINNGVRSKDLAIPRVAVVITDGQSNVNASRTVLEAQSLRDAGVNIYSVGVGQRVDSTELREIAGSLGQVIRLVDFDVTEFDGLRIELTAEACLTSVPVEISQGVSIQLQQSQVSYFQFEVPVEGVSITLSGSQGRMVLYGSYNSPNPSSALHEYSLENSGDIYIEPSASVIQKRQILQSNATLYASVEGLEAYNDFVMWSTKGDITIKTFSVESSALSSYTWSFYTCLFSSVLLIYYLS